MSEVWVVALVGAATTVGTTMYSSSEQKKAAAKAQDAADKNAIDPNSMPKPLMFDPIAANPAAVAFDKSYYAKSDEDFRQRHPLMIGAEKAFEEQVAKDQTGETELMPAMQSEFMRAGLGKSLDAFGGVGGTLAPGSAGEAAVARNLGHDIMGFQDRNRKNRNESLLMGEQIFPRRAFGMSGQDLVSALIANTQTQNNSNQAKFETQAQQAQQATNQANVDAQAEAARSVAMAQAIASGVNSAAGAYGTYAGGTAKNADGTAAMKAIPITASRASASPRSTGYLSGYTSGGKATFGATPNSVAR